ncbi:MAG: hypothetical protein WCJ35_08525 [Planctomycetota bacterium]
MQCFVQPNAFTFGLRDLSEVPSPSLCVLVRGPAVVVSHSGGEKIDVRNIEAEKQVEIVRDDPVIAVVTLTDPSGKSEVHSIRLLERLSREERHKIRCVDGLAVTSFPLEPGPGPGAYTLALKTFNPEQTVCKAVFTWVDGKVAAADVRILLHAYSYAVDTTGEYRLGGIEVSLCKEGNLPVVFSDYEVWIGGVKCDKQQSTALRNCLMVAQQHIVNIYPLPTNEELIRRSTDRQSGGKDPIFRSGDRYSVKGRLFFSKDHLKFVDFEQEMVVPTRESGPKPISPQPPKPQVIPPPEKSELVVRSLPELDAALSEKCHPQVLWVQLPRDKVLKDTLTKLQAWTNDGGVVWLDTDLAREFGFRLRAYPSGEINGKAGVLSRHPVVEKMNLFGDRDPAFIEFELSTDGLMLAGTLSEIRQQVTPLFGLVDRQTRNPRDTKFWVCCAVRSYGKGYAVYRPRKINTDEIHAVGRQVEANLREWSFKVASHPAKEPSPTSESNAGDNKTVEKDLGDDKKKPGKADKPAKTDEDNGDNVMPPKDN